MIEVEKKFILTPEQEKALIDGAEFLGEKKFTDAYYDDTDFSLTKKDIWLRSRDGKFELKIPVNLSIEERVLDQYKELENSHEILQYFNAATAKSLEDFLVSKQYKPFCKIITTRRKYKKDGFGIDLDIMNFGYTLAEIEYMTDNESKIQEATNAIIAFAEKNNIISKNVIRGKVVEYLRTNNLKHFQALIDAKVVK